MLAETLSTAPSLPSNTTLGAVILAGGHGRRMGNVQKGLLDFKGRPLIEYALDRVRPFCSSTVISANAQLDDYQAYGYHVVPDVPRYALRGPLAGIYSGGLTLLASRPEAIQILPCDSPFLPPDLVPRLWQALSQNPQASAVYARADGRDYPVIMQCRPALIAAIEVFFDRWPQQNKLMSFLYEQGAIAVDFRVSEDFININDQATLEHWQQN